MLKRLDELESRLKNRYKAIEINGTNCFRSEKGEIIHLAALKKMRAIVIEYASSEGEAKKNMFEDGDLFYVDEMDANRMYEEMLKEIEG